MKASENSFQLGQLAFTALQNCISWDPDSRQYELRFQGTKCDLSSCENGFRRFTFKDPNNAVIGSIDLPLDQIALLQQGFESEGKDKREQLLKDKVSILFHLEKLAVDIGLYDSGVFGVSYVNAGNNPKDKKKYGKTQKHLTLGSLNIPSKELGEGSVYSPMQYYYFALSRETEVVLEKESENCSEGKKNEAGSKDKAKKWFSSEIKQILESADADCCTKKTFLNEWERASRALYVRYEYLILLIIKNIEQIRAQRKEQIKTLKVNEVDPLSETIGGNAVYKEVNELLTNPDSVQSSTKPEKNHRNSIHILLKKFSDSFREQLGSKADRLRVELEELLVFDPQRFDWINDIREGKKKEPKLLRTHIEEVLKSNGDLKDDYSLKRKSVAKWYENVNNPRIDFMSNDALKKFPDLDLPHQAYLRLIAPFESDHTKKELLPLDHLVAPLNTFDRRIAHKSAAGPKDLRFKYCNDTMFMVVALQREVVKQLPVFREWDEIKLVSYYTNLLGSLNAIALQFLIIPDYVELNEKTRELAIRSAIAAIMSRNGSHNIGSHVINQVVEDINSLNIQDHKYLFRYLQQRMDFVAQISTEFPRWSTSHWLVKEIMKNFYAQRHLLNYIVASEGLKAYEGADKVDIERINCIITNVEKYDCKDSVPQKNQTANCISCINGNKQVLVCNIHGCKPVIDLVCRIDNCKPVLDGDVQVAIPGGMIGFHAFYTIMENFLRNSAKHCYATQPQQKKPMFININVWNYENEYRHYIIIMRDNYSYVSGLVDKDVNKDIEKEGEDLRDKNILMFFKDSEAVKNIKVGKRPDEGDTKKIKFDSIDNLDISANTDMVFIIDDGDILRDSTENNYERLVKSEKVRFVEETYWEDFLKPYIGPESPRPIKPDELIDFLKKYYEPVHIKMNRKIMQSLIDTDGSLRKSDWGLAEMKISAGYLNGKDIKEIGAEGKENLDNLIKAIALPERDSDGKIKAYRLGYEFKIRKPIDVLLIGYRCEKDEQKMSNLKREAILPIDRYEAEKYSAEMAVIYDSVDNNDQLLSLLKNNGDKKEEIKSEIEKYPARLFIATNEKHFIKNKGPFLKKRIVIVTKSEFDKWISEFEKNSDKEGHKYKKFKNRFLNRWLLHVKKEIRAEERAIDLIVQPKEEVLSEEDQHHEETGSSSNLLGIIGLLNVLEKNNRVDKDEKDLLIKNVIKAEIYDIKSLRKKINKRAKTFLRTSGEDILKELKISLKDINTTYGIGEGEDYLPSTLPKVFKEEKGIEVGHKRFSTCSSSDLLNEIGQIIDKEKDAKNKIIRYQRHRAVNSTTKDFDYLYREKLGGGAMHFHLFSHPPDWIEQTVCNLLENGLLRIGIADERVAGSKVLKTDDYYKDLKAAEIVFIKNFFGFKLDYVYGNNEKYIRIENAGEHKKSFIDIIVPGIDDEAIAEAKEHKKSFIDILIVHQGILDKIPNMSKDEIEEGLSNLKEKIPFIFVTSGRGRPDEIPDGVKFVPFGIIASTLLQRPHSKLLLIKQLFGGINA